MKSLFPGGFNWQHLSKPRVKAEVNSLDRDFPSDVELLRFDDPGPIAHTNTFSSLNPKSVAWQVSPKRAEDAVADKLQVDGWKFGASAAAITATVTVLVNVGFGIWASSLTGRNNELSAGILVELYHGSCEKTSTMNTWSHLAINVISTALLAGSNYCSEYECFDSIIVMMATEFYTVYTACAASSRPRPNSYAWSITCLFCWSSYADLDFVASAMPCRSK